MGAPRHRAVNDRVISVFENSMRWFESSVTSLPASPFSGVSHLPKFLRKVRELGGACCGLGGESRGLFQRFGPKFSRPVAMCGRWSGATERDGRARDPITNFRYPNFSGRDAVMDVQRPVRMFNLGVRVQPVSATPLESIGWRFEAKVFRGR